MSSFNDQYEPLDIIGNGSFGIIRKVRRKVDDVVRSLGQLSKLQILDLFRFSRERSSISKECRREIGSKLLLKCKF